MALSVWRDEAKGLINGVRLPPQRDNDDSSDTDADADVRPPGDAAATVDGGATSSSQPSSPARPRLRRRRSATSDSERESEGPSHLSDASRPPPSSPDREEAASELDALLEEEALHASAHAAQTSHTWKKPQASGDDAAMDADDDLWAALDTSAAPTAAPTTAQAPQAPNADGDDEMWDVVAELEQEQEREATRQSNSVQDPPTAVDTQADDMDDLYQ